VTCDVPRDRAVLRT